MRRRLRLPLQSPENAPPGSSRCRFGDNMRGPLRALRTWKVFSRCCWAWRVRALQRRCQSWIKSNFLRYKLTCKSGFRYHSNRHETRHARQFALAFQCQWEGLLNLPEVSVNWALNVEMSDVEMYVSLLWKRDLIERKSQPCDLAKKEEKTVKPTFGRKLSFNGMR